MTAIARPEIEDLAYNSKVEASTSMNDGQHLAERAIDGSDSFWASSPGFSYAFYKVEFLLIIIFF